MAKSSYSGLDSVVGISSGQTVSSVELDRGYNTTQEILKTTVQGKTFRAKNGSVEISMYDTQKRISAVNKFAKEHGLKVKYTR